jgi:hypothetical protein
MAQGVKSKNFGCFWTSMFLSAMCYPEKINLKNTKDKLKMNRYKRYYYSHRFIIPCKFCREFIEKKLIPDLPLDFSGRIPLMYSIYLWKDAVNNKLINQGDKKTKKSPPFQEIYNKYNCLSAKCDPVKQQCV